jgi:hypothetical protein
MPASVRRLFFLIAVVGESVFALFDPDTALAATFVVNNPGDFPDDAPGDGICRGPLNLSAPLRRCSLRAALQEANALSGADTITLPSGTFSLNRDAQFFGPVDITDNVVITGVGGAGTKIELGTFPPFDPFHPWIIANNVTAHFEGVATLRGSGLLITAGSAAFVTSSEISSAVGTSIVVAPSGALTITNSRISNSRRASAIDNAGTLTIDSSVIIGNTSASDAAGLVNRATGTAIIRTSLFQGNTATDLNVASAIKNLGSMLVVNTTFSGNASINTGAVRAEAGQLALVHVTMTRNGGNGIHFLGGSISGMQSVLLFGNTQANCPGPVPFDPNPQFQQNFDGDGSCGFPAATNFTGDPLLGQLADNGGPTFTHALQPGSPAIDRAICNTVIPVTTDQRGVTRPTDGDADGVRQCDIGAFERSRQVPGGVGVGTLTPRDATVAPNQLFTQTVTWDVPGPDSWNALSTVEYRLRTDGRIMFWLRWDQTTNLFQLLDANGNPVGAPRRGGTPTTLSTDEVTLDLTGLDGRGSGPTCLRATLTLPLTFGDSLVGKLLTVELSGSNDFGAADPFKTAGTIRIGAVAVQQVQQSPSPNNDAHEDEGRVHRDKDDRKPPSEQAQRERENTNRLGSDDYRTEGNVISAACDADPATVTIANRDGPVVVALLGETRLQCGSFRPGQYLEIDGTKVHEGWFEAETVYISRR